MIWMEGKRLLFNARWKYLLLVILLSIAYGTMVYNDLPQTVSTSFGTGLLTTLTHDQLLMSISIMPSFLYAFLLYGIAMQEEPVSTWLPQLAFPFNQRKRILCKTICLILLILPAMFSSMLLYHWLGGYQRSCFLMFLTCIHSIYLLGYLYYCFYVSRGYLATGGTITVVNVLERLIPIFLGFCILNAGQWSLAFYRLGKGILLMSIIVYLLLIIFCSSMMHTKIYRELVLTKLFKNMPLSMSDLLREQYKGRADTLLQMLFKYLDRGGTHYWKRCAMMELSLKQQFYSYLMVLVFMILAITQRQLLYLFVSICFLLYIRHRAKRESARLGRICIFPEQDT